MKKLFILITLCQMACLAFGQNPVQVSQPQQFNKFVRTMDSIIARGPVYLKSLQIGTGTKVVVNSNGQVYRDTTADAEPLIPGGPITSLPALAFNPGTNLNSRDWIIKSYYQTQAPTGGLSGGLSQERVASGGNLSYSLSWSYGRAAATANIASATITGASQTYPVFSTQPSAPGSISGTQSVNVPRNVSTTFTNTVTTVDGKTFAATTSFSFYDRRYCGFATSALQGDGTPTDANIIAAQFKDNNGANTTIATTLSMQPSDRYMFIATTAPVSNITLNGFASTAAFNLNISRVFVNSVGGSQTYYISVSKNPFGSTSTTSVSTN